MLDLGARRAWKSREREELTRGLREARRGGQSRRRSVLHHLAAAAGLAVRVRVAAVLGAISDGDGAGDVAGSRLHVSAVQEMARGCHAPARQLT